MFKIVIRIRPRWFLVFLGAFFLTACAGKVGSRAVRIEDKRDFIKALQDAGVDLRETTIEVKVDLGAPAETLQVNTAMVYVYEYESEEARTTVSASLAVDGSSLEGQPLLWPDRINLWSTGRLIVAYPGTDGGTIVLLNGLLGDPITQPSPAVDEPFPPAVAAAVGFLAERLDVNPGDVEVTEFVPTSWSDACLGLPDEGEICDQVVTPGWKIMMRIGGEDFEIHSDQIGDNIRLKGQQD